MSDVMLRDVTVLLVEDDVDAREGLAALVELWGARVVTAATVADAVGRATEGGIDIAICDLGLPDDDGLRLPARVAAGAGRGIPMLALTGHASVEARIAVERAGFARHLAKPANPNDLLAALVALVGGARHGARPIADATRGHRRTTSG